MGAMTYLCFEVDVTSVSADDERSEISETNAMLFSRDDTIRATLENVGISVIQTTRPEQVKAAVCALQRTFGYRPVVFADHRELDDNPEGGVNTLGGLREITSGVALSHYRKLHAMDISLRDITPRRRLRAMSL
jgi:hypothetical protein